MTHDELLASVSPDGFRKNNNALRAVIELHKPKGTLCKTCYFIYPCPTIQMIEKELG